MNFSLTRGEGKGREKSGVDKFEVCLNSAGRRDSSGRELAKGPRRGPLPSNLVKKFGERSDFTCNPKP